MRLTGIWWNDNIIKFHQLSAGVAELADALDLGSSVPDVQVQVTRLFIFGVAFRAAYTGKNIICMFIDRPGLI